MLNLNRGLGFNPEQIFFILCQFLILSDMFVMFWNQAFVEIVFQ